MLDSNFTLCCFAKLLYIISAAPQKESSIGQFLNDCTNGRAIDNLIYSLRLSSSSASVRNVLWLNGAS